MGIPEMVSWIGSILALAAFLQGVIPHEYRDYVSDGLLHLISPHTYFVIPEHEGSSANELYDAVQTYLSSITRQRARVSNLSKQKNAKEIIFSLARRQRIRDSFEKVWVEWIHHNEERKHTSLFSDVDERRSFTVKMPRKQKDFLVEKYFSFIMSQAKVLERSNRDLNLYSNKKADERSYGSRGGWNCIPFKHPANFDTVAMDPDQKFSILSDLDNFVNGEEFYRRVGKAWKRGYLLFGPPGTGKTSIIAAMANKLRYDIYDLELTEVKSNAALRQLLFHTADKSLVVIEDIDCSLDLSGQRKKKKTEEKAAHPDLRPGFPAKEEDKESKVTLSGLLNFTDGLWSSCASERIFVFTTNFVNKLDPALLRPGRMDMHIHLGYCRYPAFKTLARNFLQITAHPRFADVQQTIESSFATPAEIAEILTKDRGEPDLALDLVVKALQDRKSEPPHHRQDDATEPAESGELPSDGEPTAQKTKPTE